MTKLEPCPFCGGEAVVMPAKGVYAPTVGCASEYCVIRPEAIYRNIRKAIAAWNTRIEHTRTTPAEPSRDALVEAEPVAWLHTLHMELGQTQERLGWFDGRDADEPDRTFFGLPGRDYSEEYTVTSEPLYTRAALKGDAQ